MGGGRKAGSRKRCFSQDNVDNDNNAEPTKFIGGAERARREARKRQRRPPPNAANRGGTTKALPKSLPPSERFFAALLMSSVDELLCDDSYNNNNNNNNNNSSTLQKICERLGLPLPQKLPKHYENESEYYRWNAALVMEESRCILAQALRLDHKKGRPQHNVLVRGRDIPVALLGDPQTTANGKVILTFRRKSTDGFFDFTPSEVHNMKPGCCVQVQWSAMMMAPNNSSSTGAPVALMTSVVPDSKATSESISLMVYRTQDLPASCSQQGCWRLRPVTTLISQLRQFEACTKKAKTPFLSKWIGQREPTHIRFIDEEPSETGEEVVHQHTSTRKKRDDGNSSDKETTLGDTRDKQNEEKSGQSNSDSEDYIPFVPLSRPSKSHKESQKQKLSASCFRQQELNPMQEKAMNSFVNSEEGSLKLVQGPPGTGKTTLTVAIIAQLLEHGRRILVTAPTNKAIHVISTRFCNSFQSSDYFPNVVMIGVEEKLISDFSRDIEDHKSGEEQKLRQIFVYTWIDSIVQDISAFQNMMQSSSASNLSIRTKLLRWKHRLFHSIPSCAKDAGLLVLMEQADQMLSQEDEEHCASTGGLIMITQTMQQLKDSLLDMDSSFVIRELLATASVIFCTLSTAGVSVMKGTRHVDDLLVDEAAAATEPEICIPFHLRPKRLLTVGDPMQLPAMVTSPHAARLGLGQSVYERLLVSSLDGCKTAQKNNELFTMLNIQYRMKPDICIFPSNHFYGGRLENGPNVTRPDYTTASYVINNKPYKFLHVQGRERQTTSGSYSNIEEAKSILRLVRQLHDRAKQHDYKAPSILNNMGEKKAWHSSDRLRIITFYQGQVALLQTLLKDANYRHVLVATVDSSQGCEADTVILSLVRSHRSVGFLKDKRRMNVSLTRARYQMICVGCESFLWNQQEDQLLHDFVQDARSRNICVTSQIPRSNKGGV